MIGVDRVRFVDSEAVPWANGTGSTRVLIDDADARGGEWSYRISVAELVGAQRFSRFEDIDRHLTFLGPGVLSMHVDGRTHLLAELDTIHFNGAADVSSEPSAPRARDLNVMTRRGVCRAEATRTDGRDELAPDPRAHAAIWISLTATGRIEGESLDELDLVRLTPGRRWRTDGAGLLVEIRAVGEGGLNSR